MDGTWLLPLTRRRLLSRTTTFALGWLLLPERLRAGPAELRITVVTPPAGAAWEGARMGVEEATHTADLLRRALHIQHVEVSTPEEAAAMLVGSNAVGGTVVWALETDDRSSAALALEQVAEGRLVLDARSIHEPDAACGARTFRIGIPSPGNPASAPELWHASLNRYGATQLNHRFLSRFGHGMDGVAWAAWFGVKVAAEVAFRAADTGPDALAGFLTGEAAAFDGHKGRPLRFSASRHALEQPLYVPGPDGEPWDEAPDGGVEPTGPACLDADPRERG